MNELETKATSEESKPKKDFAYILGRAFGAIVVGCLSAIAIATTVRLIAWIL